MDLVVAGVQQFVLAGVFFLGVAGWGLPLLRYLGYPGKSPKYHLGIAYFLALCLYVVGAVIGLHFVPQPLFFLPYFSVFFLLLGYFFLVRAGVVRALRDHFRTHRWQLCVGGGILIGGMIPFFLQLYHTALLDEWLHRPVVSSFVANGVFPLVNPLAPDTPYTLTYHYGSQVLSAALVLLTDLDVDAGLDVLKLATFLATEMLFVGLLLCFGVRWRTAFLAAVGLLYLGGSFFLADPFMVSHLKNFFGLPAVWPSNVPLSFGLSSITGVNAPLGIALFFALHSFFSRGALSYSRVALWGVLFGGAFLLSEYIAVLLLSVAAVFLGSGMVRRTIPVVMGGVSALVTLVVLVAVILATGGLTKALITPLMKQTTTLFSERVDTTLERGGIEVSAHGEESSAAATQVKAPHFFRMRAPHEWGFPAEKNIVTVVGNGFAYLRSFLLELCVLALLVVAHQRHKKVGLTHTDRAPLLFALALIAIPFFLSSPYGDLNISKSLPLGLALLHLLLLKAVLSLGLRKAARVGLLALCVLGMIPGWVLGSNIQWRWISSKGKSQYCSQNPRCIQPGPLTDLLRTFEATRPGLKHIQTAPKDAAKVVDLTNSYVYRAVTPDVEYIVETRNGEQAPQSDASAGSNDYTRTRLLYENGPYRIWQIEPNGKPRL